MLTHFDQYSNLRPQILKVLNRKTPSSFNKENFSSIVEALCFMTMTADSNHISYFHSVWFQNKFKISSKILTDWLRKHKTLVILVSKHIQNQQCRRWDLSRFFTGTFKEAIRLDQLALTKLAKEDPEEYRKLIKTRKLTKEKTHFNEETQNYQLNLGSLLQSELKNPSLEGQDAMRWLVTNGNPTLDPDIYSIDIHTFQYLVGGRTYQELGGIQCLPDWIKKLLLTPKEAEDYLLNLDLVGCHKNLFKQDLEDNEIEYNPELFTELEDYSGGADTSKLVMIASINLLGNRYTDKDGEMTKFAEIVESETPKNQQILQELSVNVKSLVKTLCKKLDISCRGYWKRLHQLEQNLILPMISILKENNFSYINMHDGVLILDKQKFFGIPELMVKFQEIATSGGLTLVEKMLKSR